jgi:hypothetical protein
MTAAPAFRLYLFTALRGYRLQSGLFMTFGNLNSFAKGYYQNGIFFLEKTKTKNSSIS